MSIERFTNVKGAMVAAYSVPGIRGFSGSSSETVAVVRMAKSWQPISLVEAFPLKLNAPRQRKIPYPPRNHPPPPPLRSF